MLNYNHMIRHVILPIFALLSGILISPLTTMPQPTSSTQARSDFIQLDLGEAAAKQFLTLPFNENSNMRVIQGWFYASGYTHYGIDYIKGTGKTFDVLAAADGRACGNCVDGPGNKVWIKHTVGNTVYYTYYGHLATIVSSIPLWSGATVKVTRGQKIGTAGNTGTYLIHLHFAVYNASWVAIDPYDLYTTSYAYYPNSNYRRMGSDHLFTHDPPFYPSQAVTNRSIIIYLPLTLQR